jgi:hypothetical protein
MARVERGVVGRLAAIKGAKPVALSAAVVDTPYAFQANADALSEAAIDHYSNGVWT